MSELFKKVIQFLGILFAALVIGFTGYQTYSLLAEVSGNALIAWLGLALFEGGMLYWWFVFQKEAEGIGQLALSLLLFVFGLALVAGSTGLHLGAIDAAALGANTPAKLVTVAAIINLIGKTLYPIFSPKTFGHIWERALEGVVMAKAYAAAQGKADDMAEQLADNVGNEIVRRLTVSVLTNHQLRHEAEKNPPTLPLLGKRNTIEAINFDDEREVVAADGSPAPTTRPRDYADTQASPPPSRPQEPVSSLFEVTQLRDGGYVRRSNHNTLSDAETAANGAFRDPRVQAVLIRNADGDQLEWLNRPDSREANGVQKDSPLAPAGTRPE